MKYILQFYTGSGNTAAFRAEEIIRKVEALTSGMAVSGVIIGWSRDADAYREIGDFLRGRGIRMLLWLPVFAESGGDPAPDPAVDVFGNAAATPKTEDGEGFRFVCPSSERNTRMVKEIYERVFSGCGFDGVFLDRVRGRSFAAGVSGVLSCACERCAEQFRRKGVDVRAVRERYEERGDAFFDVDAWPENGAFVLKDPLAQRFFEAREEITADAAAGIIRYFRDRGLLVGLDLFAPAVSRLAGQNYPLMAGHADFIKPMLYRRTEAPAGIGYEYGLFRKHAPDARVPERPAMDLAFLRGQLRAAGRVPCRIYPGIEVNYDERLVRTDPAYIRESLAAAGELGLEGAVLSWNVLQAPEANLEAAASVPG